MSSEIIINEKNLKIDDGIFLRLGFACLRQFPYGTVDDVLLFVSAFRDANQQQGLGSADKLSWSSLC